VLNKAYKKKLPTLYIIIYISNYNFTNYKSTIEINLRDCVEMCYYNTEVYNSLHLKIINYLHKSKVRSQVFIEKIISRDNTLEVYMKSNQSKITTLIYVICCLVPT